MAEGHCRHVRMQALSCGERGHPCRDRWIDPELLIKTLDQLQVRLELPRELPEGLVLLVCSRKLRVCAGLTVVVAQVLKSRKKPDSIATHWATKIRREVTVLDVFISAERWTTT